MKNKEAQIWLETVIYTLIGLALIGVVLAIITPKINEAKDRALIEQSIDALNILDSKVRELIDYGPGNVRVINEFGIDRGELLIDSEIDAITFILTGLGKPYSQPDIKIEMGNIILLTQEKQKSYMTSLLLNYSSFANITYGVGRDDVLKKMSSSSKPYEFTITNYGLSGQKIEINVQDTTQR